jgi:general nucleoside transport system permease protein
MRLEPRGHAGWRDALRAGGAALGVVMGVAALLVASAGAPVAQTFGLMLNGAFGSLFALSETLTRAIPLLFTGLAATVAFRARLFNIGAEGPPSAPPPTATAAIAPA